MDTIYNLLMALNSTSLFGRRCTRADVLTAFDQNGRVGDEEWEKGRKKNIPNPFSVILEQNELLRNVYVPPLCQIGPD